MNLVKNVVSGIGSVLGKRKDPEPAPKPKGLMSGRKLSEVDADEKDQPVFETSFVAPKGLKGKIKKEETDIKECNKQIKQFCDANGLPYDKTARDLVFTGYTSEGISNDRARTQDEMDRIDLREADAPHMLEVQREILYRERLIQIQLELETTRARKSVDSDGKPMGVRYNREKRTYEKVANGKNDHQM